MMMADIQPLAGHRATFRFSTEQRLVQLTGMKAKTIRQLLVHLQNVPGSSIFYHTHQRFLEHHFEKPIVPNDFAVWVRDALQDDALGERLAFIDLRDFTTVRQLREAIISIIEQHLVLFNRSHANSACRTSHGVFSVTGDDADGREARSAQGGATTGHTRPDILLKHYAHVLDESAEFAAETLSSQLSGKKVELKAKNGQKRKTSPSIGSQTAASNRRWIM